MLFSALFLNWFGLYFYLDGFVVLKMLQTILDSFILKGGGGGYTFL